METLVIKGLSENTLKGLRERAERHHRSLEHEIRILLHNAALMMPQGEVPGRRLNIHAVRSGKAGSWSRHEPHGCGGVHA